MVLLAAAVVFFFREASLGEWPEARSVAGAQLRSEEVRKKGLVSSRWIAGWMKV